MKVFGGHKAGFSFIRLLMSVFFLFSIAGCEKPPTPLRLGANVWPGYEPLFLAQDLGYFAGRPIQLITFPSATEVMRAYRNQAVDVAALTADEVLQIAEKLPGQKIVLVCDFSHGADCILAKPQFPTMNGLRGKRIGLESGALGAYVLARSLEISGMNSNDVIVVPVPLEEHETVFKSGGIDAVVTFEPRCSRLLAAGAVQVFDSSKIPGEIVDVLLTRQEFLEKNPQSMHLLVEGWFRARDHMKQEPMDSAVRMAKREQTTPENFLNSLQGLEFPDRLANQGLLGKSPKNLEAVLKQLSAVMVKTKLLSGEVNNGNLLDDSLVSQDRQ